MTRRYGIDTSILVRLLTGDPPEAYEYCVEVLSDIAQNQGGEVFASNQVIGEAYMVMQLHYGASKTEARQGLATLLRTQYVMPQNGRQVFAALEETGGAGLIDRLIADGYAQTGLETLTLGQKMSNLPDAKIL